MAVHQDDEVGARAPQSLRQLYDESVRDMALAFVFGSNSYARGPACVGRYFGMTQSTDLVEAFLSKRGDLRRYFAARVGDAEADDLVQDVYLRILSLPDQAELRSPAAYLYRLASNIMIDRLRNRRARQARDAGWRDATVTTGQSGQDMCDAAPADRVLIARDRLMRLQTALRQLPGDVQRTFHLHKVEGLSHSECAERLGVSRSLIEKHMMRALKHLLAVPE